MRYAHCTVANALVLYGKPEQREKKRKRMLQTHGIGGRMMDDTISRRAAIDATWFEPSYTDPLNVLTEVRDRLKALPSAQPERKRGKWLDEPVYKQTTVGKTWDGYTYCSVCKEMHEYGYRSKFCPNCGAEMEGE